MFSVLIEVGMHMGNRSAYFVADHIVASVDYIQARADRNKRHRQSW
jgi:hypothetical protein